MSRCRLFPRLESEVRLRICLETYCFGDFGSCARHQHGKMGKPPDDDLLPNGKRLDESAVGATPVRRDDDRAS